MKTPNVLLSSSLVILLLGGCHADSSKAGSSEPVVTSSPPPTNVTPESNSQDCAAIKDSAQAENCRLWKEIAAAKKKHSSAPAVKHSPGSIPQP